MIAIQYNSEFLDLYNNTSLSLQAKSPFFGFESIGGSRIYNFRVPASPKNNRLLENPSLLIAEPGVMSYKGAYVYLAGQIYRNGTLKLRDADDSDITLSFHTEAGDLASVINEMAMKDLQFNNYDVNLNPVLLQPDLDYCLPTLKNPGLYSGQQADYAGYLNYYSNNSYQFNTTANRYALAPQPYVLAVFRAIEKTLGYTFNGSFFQRPDVQRMFLVNLTTLDGGDLSLNRYRRNFNLSEMMPDMKVGNFLLQFRNLLGLALHFSANDQMVRVSELRELLDDSNYVDITKRAGKSYKRSFRTEEGFMLNMQIDTNDLYMKNLPSEWTTFTVGSGQEPITSNASPLQMVSEQDQLKAAKTWTLPGIDQTGSSAFFGLDKKLMSLRLMYYLGLKNDDMFGQFPKADYRYVNKSLRFEGGDGIYQQSYRTWLDFLSKSSEVEREVQFSIEDLIEFDFSQKIIIDSVPYFIKEYSVTLSKENSLKPANVKLAKIP